MSSELTKALEENVGRERFVIPRIQTPADFTKSQVSTATPLTFPQCQPSDVQLGLSLETYEQTKARALALLEEDKSIPKELRLTTGEVQELADGVFAKKRDDGILELYISEE